MPLRGSLEWVLNNFDKRIESINRRLAANGGGGSGDLLQGTTLERDAFYGVPAGASTRVALANKNVRFFNTDKQFIETYRVAVGTPGLIVPGIFGGLPAGWYIEESKEWAVLGGPMGHTGAPGGAYACTWAKGVTSASPTLNPFNTFAGSVHGVTVGMSGQYEVVGRQRAASVNAYIALALNGDRAALENRAEGVFDHDHAGIVDGFTTSHYIGALLRGEIVTMGPPPGQGGTMRYGASTFNGTLTVRRLG